MMGHAWANTIVVNSTADSGSGSLRNAVVAATSGDTIQFDASLDMDTIKLTTGEITLNKDLVIIGNGETNTIIDGQANSRIFYIPIGDTVVIHGVTLQNGNGTGAIFSGDGGAILNRGKATFTNTTIMGNNAGSGGGVGNSDVAIFTNTTITGNNAGIGGGVCNRDFATFTNTTISGNNAILGGGVDNSDVAIFINTTITGNNANNSVGGVDNIFGIATFTNTIVARNGAGLDINNSSSTIIDGGNNLIGDGTGQTTILDGMNGNIVGTSADPIDPLFIMDVPTGVGATTGGDLRLQDASPAIDAGNDTANTTTTDILGNPRIVGTIDIGAFENQNIIASPTIPTLGQWGLIILALSIPIVSLLSLRELRVSVVRDFP